MLPDVERVAQYRHALLLLTLNGHGQNEDSASERIPVPCDLAAATVNPHRLAAFAWAVIRHAGSAPWRSGDLAALDRV